MVSRSRRLVVDGTRRRTGRARVANPRPPRRLRPVIGALFALALLAGAVRAGDIQVPADHPTIQAAIDAAADGDRVLVAPGRYPEAIRFLGKDIQVIGTAGRDATVIDATGLGTSVVSFDDHEPDTALLQGFTITGGTGQAVPVSGLPFGGGGVAVFPQSVPTIRECRITGNHVVGHGGGLLVVGPPNTCWIGIPCPPGPQVRVIDCLVSGNSASWLGGGLWAGHGRCTLIRSRFVGNVAEHGGGIALGTTRCELDEVVIEGNTAIGDGGGLHASDVELTMNACLVRRNVAGGDGGGASWSASSFGAHALNPVVLHRTTFLGNRASRGGGAKIHGGDGSVGISLCLFVDNVSTEPFNSGSGVWATATPPCYGGPPCDPTFLSVTACTFVRNGLDADVDEVSITRSIFWDVEYGPEQLSADHVVVELSDVQGGWSGAGSGNFDADPQFVDPAGGDLHLTAGSPCLESGGAGPTQDWEGDLDPGLRDVGGDAFAPHLYEHPAASGAGSVVLRVVGPPGEPAWILAGFVEDEAGLPNRFGSLHVPAPWLDGFPLRLGPLPATGVGEARLPAGLPGAGRVVYAQALVGDAAPVLTNALRLDP